MLAGRDQGSVVVLRRREHSFRLCVQLVLTRDLNYSGSIPTATTSDPRCVGPAYPVGPVGMITHQGSGIAQIHIYLCVRPYCSSMNTHSTQQGFGQLIPGSRHATLVRYDTRLQVSGNQGSVLVHNTKTPANRGVMCYN